ncbi:hypothetical protein C3L33_05329, partial [Rhododendron williamsianum]
MASIRLDASKQYYATSSLVVGYALCSSLLAVINKFAITKFNYPVSLSCVFGLLISFFGFAARKAISATAFTVTGVVNKFLTVLINVLIWDKHAGPFGLVCLLVTIAGGVLYQQSVTGAASTAPSQHDSAASKLIDSENDGVEDEEKGISGKISG